jgi:hypothetical protein
MEAKRNRPLLGLGRYMIPIPRFLWRRAVARNVTAIERRLAFMSGDYHRVRDFAVRELPRVGQPLAPGLIAKELSLTAVRTQEILDDLEKRLVFLFRNDEGAVAWAYPVTADPTPHHAAFSTGERLDAA